MQSATKRAVSPAADRRPSTDTIDDESRPWLAQIDPHTADVNYLF